MTPKKLTVEEMNQISGPMLEEGGAARAAIEKIPLLAALLPQLQSAHVGVVFLRAPIADPKLRLLSERLGALDLELDERVRGIYGALTGLAQVSGAATELLALRDTLFPEGLGHTQMSYRGQADHAARVVVRLEGGLQARLKAVSLHDKNLWTLVQQYLAVAKQMGQLEDERARLSPTLTSGAEINNARQAWVRTMNALRANAALASIDDATDRLLFDPLRAAEKTASTRGRGKSTATTLVPRQA